MKISRFFLCMLAAVMLLSCGKKKEEKSFPDQRSDEWKETRKEFKSLIEMPFDFSDLSNYSFVRQMENKGYRYTLNQDDDIDKTVGGYTFSVYGRAYENPDFKNGVTIRITKKDWHMTYPRYHEEDAICNWYHDNCPLSTGDRVGFISMLTAAYGKPQEIWIDAAEVNPDYWWTHLANENKFAENHLAQNLFWQLEDRKIFIRKDSVDFVIKIFLQEE